MIGEKFGKPKDELAMEPFLSWKGSRKRYNLPDILEKEMETHGKVSVKLVTFNCKFCLFFLVL